MPRSQARVGSIDRETTEASEQPGSVEGGLPPALDPARPMLIGEVAAATGLTQRTLRYYEEIGLLPQSSRLDGGFRLYTETDVLRLRRITDLKRLLGFSLVEIKEMVEIEDERRELRSAYHRAASPVERHAHVARSLDLSYRQLAKLENRLGGLLELKGKIQERIGRYEAELARLGAVGARGPDEERATEPLLGNSSQ